MLYGVFGTICLAVGVFCRLAPTDRRPAGWWVLPAAFLVTLAGGWLERRWRRERAWRAARAVGEIVAEFGDARFGVAAGAERGFVEWRAFRHYRELPRLFALYQGASLVRWIPKAAFDDDPSALAEVRRLLDAHVRLTVRPGRQAVRAGFPVKSQPPDGPAPAPREHA